MKKTLKIIIAAVVIISLANYIYCEHRVRSVASLVEVGMTKADVIRKCGKPTVSGQLIDPAKDSEKVVGSFINYAFPYWWDIAAWKIRGFATGKYISTAEGQPSIEHSPKCQIEFLGIDDDSIVFVVLTSRGYSDRSTVIKGTISTDR